MAAIPLTTPMFVRQSFIKGAASQTGDDNFIASLIGAFSGSGDPTALSGFESYCDRVFPFAEYTEYLSSDGGTQRLFVYGYPISTAEIWIDSQYTWGANTKLAATDFVIDPTGLPIITLRGGGTFSAGQGHIKVKYFGGLITSDQMVPSVLALACAMQVAHVYQGRNRLGISGESSSSSSVSMYSEGTYLPQVKEILSSFVRHIM